MEIQNIKTSQTENITLTQGLDSEWLQLLLEAKAIGLSLEEVKAFLNKPEAIKSNL